MSLPRIQLRPISTDHYYLSGDVTIEAGAAIAPGVLIQADPGSQIRIKHGVCIGIGSILHATAGILEIGEGANIGAEVLLIGQLTIGANACIGSATTILNCSVELGQVIPPGSLIGDASRPITQKPKALAVTDTVELSPTEEVAGNGNEPSAAAANLATDSINVYGQMYVNQLMFKLFPQQASLEPPPTEAKQSSDDPWDD